MGWELGTGGWVGSLMLLGRLPFRVLPRPATLFPELGQPASARPEGTVRLLRAQLSARPSQP